MSICQSKYHSYLLRLWQVVGDDGSHWRASLEDVQTKEMHGFENIEALLEYLEEQTFSNREIEVVVEKQPD